MNQIEIFNSPEFGSIRTLEQNGKVLFCGTDVATALGYTNPRKAVRDHTRGGTKCSIGVQTGKKADGSPAVQMVEMLFMREVVQADRLTTCGGDGGCNICGGLGPFLGFLPCSPHCKPEVQEDNELNGDYDFYRPIIRVDVN